MIDLDSLRRDGKVAIKPLLILLAIITFSTPISYTSDCPLPNLKSNPLDYTSFKHYEFFIAVFVILFLFESLLLGLYITAMDFLMSISYNWWFLELIYSVIWGFFCLLSSCLFSDGITHAENFYKDHGNPDCGYAGWKFGVAVGIITSLAMGGKSYYLFIELRKSRIGFNAQEQAPLTSDLSPTEEVTVSV